jgi:hypothetical protein
MARIEIGGFGVNVLLKMGFIWSSFLQMILESFAEIFINHSFDANVVGC